MVVPAAKRPTVPEAAAAPALTPRLLTGWGRTAATLGYVSSPTSAQDVGRALGAAGSRGVVARGLGRSYGDPAQNAGGAVLDMTALTGIHRLDLEGRTVTVAAGTSLDALMRALVPSGLLLPVMPGTRLVSVGGAIAADVHGKNHHRDGGFADHVTSMVLMVPDGRRLVLTPDGTPDAFRATGGGMGLTGVILEATLRLLPIETSWISVDTERADDVDDLMERMAGSDHRYRYSVAWVDGTARRRGLGRAVLTRGDHAPIDALPASARRDPLRFDPKPLVGVPAGVPGWLLGAMATRAFNAGWYRKAPREEHARPRRMASFFHPLDAVANWNRLYGRRGFVQYQFVVPDGEEAALRGILERLAGYGHASFLTVLKRFGPGSGLLSFPIPGWTLAVDVPARPAGLGPLLDSFDRRVADAGGRVYLAKDGRMRPEAVSAMYPELERWRQIRAELDPGGLMRSDQARRLGLTDGPRLRASTGAVSR